MFRQGDVLILKVNNFDKSQIVKAIDRDKGGVVLAYGEVTGHSHQIREDAATLFSLANQDNDRLLTVSETVNLVHEEHSTIVLEPGDYLIRKQREYIPNDVRLVAD